MITNDTWSPSAVDQLLAKSLDIFDHLYASDDPPRIFSNHKYRYHTEFHYGNFRFTIKASELNATLTNKNDNTYVDSVTYYTVQVSITNKKSRDTVYVTSATQKLAKLIFTRLKNILLSKTDTDIVVLYSHILAVGQENLEGRLSLTDKD